MFKREAFSWKAFSRKPSLYLNLIHAGKVLYLNRKTTLYLNLIEAENMQEEKRAEQLLRFRINQGVCDRTKR
jgi:hypothetical protein